MAAQHPVATPSVHTDDALTRAAMDVLVANQLGEATRPSPRLYPHQWSWDAAFIAMGYSHLDQARAQKELRSLFAGQWANGLLPHIVFSDADAGAGHRYFPGPEFWQVERSPDAPAGGGTSGIVQPPVHATAALRVYRNATDRDAATAFIAELLPQLAAWHGYLYRERTREGSGLVEIWHPWESGMDNSPLWDEALARIRLSPEEVPSYRRIDTDFNDVSQRPSDAEYDRYAYLVRVFRDLRYDPARIREVGPFAVRPVLFNAVLVQADRDLAELARLLGADPAPYEAWADRTASSLEAMWDHARQLYADFDVRSGAPVPSRCATGFAPLYAGVPDDQRASAMMERLLASLMPLGRHGGAVPSLPPEDPGFEPSRYWRGPVWPVLHWLLSLGLRRYGRPHEAQQLGDTFVDLVRHGGFWEHYHPITGRGQGGEQFAWTAAIVLDLLLDGEGSSTSTTAHTKEAPDGSDPTGQ